MGKSPFFGGKVGMEVFQREFGSECGDLSRRTGKGKVFHRWNEQFS
jgi:hypothetical protein